VRELHAARDPVVFVINGVGDHLLALPALRALAEIFDGRLRFLGLEGVVDTYFGDVRFASVHAVERVRSISGAGAAPGSVAGWTFDAEAAISEISRCDVFLSLNPWRSEAADVLLERLAPLESIGYFPCFSRPLALDFGKHSAELAFDVARAVDPASSRVLEDHAAAPWLRPDSVKLAERVRDATAGFRLLAVHADTKPEKTWPWNRFVVALDAFLDAHQDFLALLVGRTRPSTTMPEHNDRLLDLRDMSLPDTFAIVGAADLFLGVDSCFLHAADFLRVPGVGLFGPTKCHEFGFRFAPHRHVTSDSDILAIGEDEVLEALESLAGEQLEVRR
jgi:Glycosyltransferase family 9 (heptosyltransferase)